MDQSTEKTEIGKERAKVEITGMVVANTGNNGKRRSGAH